jgi:hypothetical protein
MRSVCNSNERANSVPDHKNPDKVTIKTANARSHVEPVGDSKFFSDVQSFSSSYRTAHTFSNSCSDNHPHRGTDKAAKPITQHGPYKLQ